MSISPTSRSQLQTIDEMDELMATLSFARDEATSEISKRIDIGAVSSIADDMAMLVWP